MKLQSVKDKTSQLVTLDGILSCRFDYSVKSGSANVKYSGPRIAPHVWREVLAFFEWTHHEHKTESQVRLYVHPLLGWCAHAFPQEMQSGLSAKELDTTEAQSQRMRFAEPWVYLGTVHHHCNVSAFQSGTDKANEQNQDGLHITVGNIGSDRYDIHARFYLSGNGFEPDMSLFWDIGEQAKALLPPDTHGRVALWQMTQPAGAEAAFPDEWKSNCIVRQRIEPHWSKSDNDPITLRRGYSGSGIGWQPKHVRVENACKEMMNDPRIGNTLHFCEAVLAVLAIPEFEIVREFAARFDVNADDLLDEIESWNGETPEAQDKAEVERLQAQKQLSEEWEQWAQ